jgi:hypothetical protein
LKKKKVLILFSALSALLIAASIFKILSTSEGNGFVIKHLSDGSSIIVNKTDGYQFLVSNKWHPILFPATEEDVVNFKNIAEKKGVPADGVLASLPTKEYAKYFPLFLLDLDSNHYTNSDISLGGIIQFDVLGADFFPLESFLNRLKTDKKVSNLYQIEKNNEIVHVFELNLEPEMFKMAALTRNNKFICFFVVTDNREVFTDISSFLDETINSIELVSVE